MAIVEDSTDPKGTKRSNRNLLLVPTHIFKPVVVIERPPKIYLPLNIDSNDVYGIFSLFFINDVLDILIKNTKKYGALHY